MLKALPLSKVQRALEILSVYLEGMTTQNTQRLRLSANEVVVTWPDGTRLVLWKRLPADIGRNDLVLDAVKQLYGGDLDKLMAVEVFNDGYVVELKTGVVDRNANREDGGVHVREVRVGRLLH